MRVRGIFASLVCLSFAVAPLAAAPPLQPIGPWNVAYEDSQCTASRNYGSEDKPLILTLVPSATGSAMRLLFVRTGGTATTQEQAELTLGAGKPMETYAFIYEAPQTHHRVYMVNVPMAEFRAAAVVPSIALKTGTLRAQLAVSELPEMLVELDKCLVDLQDYWHVSKSTQRGPLSARPEQPIGLIASSDYPALALDRNLSGSVGLTMLIDEHGNVADCTVDVPSGTGILDVVSCFLVQRRARFLPARDAGGKPVKSSYSQTIAWRIADGSQADYPSRALKNHEQGSALADVAVNVEGHPVGCAIVVSSSSSLLDEATCRMILARTHFDPAKNELGRPVETHMKFRLNWVIPRCRAPVQTDPRLQEPVAGSQTVISLKGC